MTPAVALAHPPADLERRLTAYVIDRIVVWGAYAVVVAAVSVHFAEGRRVVGVLTVVSVVLLVNTALVALLGLRGTSPGRALLQIRIVDPVRGAPIGLPDALARSLLLGVAGVPTAGLGLALLAWTAASDPSGRRRGWHDLRVGTVAVDLRAPMDTEEVRTGPPPLVNLTAMRLRSPTRIEDGVVVPAPRGPNLEGSGAPSGGRAWRVAFERGPEFVVEGLALVGRRPEARDGEPARHTVVLDPGDLSISKTHAQFQVTTEGSLVVMDRGSVNGTAIVRQGVARPLTPGRPATLLPGDIVRFGDQTMTVDRS